VSEASEPLRTRYVAGGKTSVEVRNAVRDRYDMTAAMLARCGGPRRFFGNHEALFANQDAWMEKLMAYDQSAPRNPDQVTTMRDIGRNTGLYDLMKKRGFTEAQLDACIADPVANKAVMAMTEEAWKTLKIHGTPAFTVNGALVDGSSWEKLQPALP
jgi:protein-disulfide isomerase